MGIKYLDMFYGIGGFRSALDRVGGFECVGFCEIDEKAKETYEAIYDTKGEMYFNDAREINPNALPDIDLICGGFPCQSFSIAGKRGGFEDTRGTLFFEIARIASVKKPKYMLLENVPGLLNHDQGRTFQKIISSLDELGYDVTWQVYNSKNFGVPQSRKRLYIVCYYREKVQAKYLLSLKQLLQILSDASEEVKVIECTPLMVHQLLSQARQEDLAEKQDFT